jgi:hypothetical protein
MRQRAGVLPVISELISGNDLARIELPPAEAPKMPIFHPEGRRMIDFTAPETKEYHEAGQSPPVIEYSAKQCEVPTFSELQKKSGAMSD